MRAAAKAAGHPNFLLANNEYGLGKESNFVNFSRFDKGMVNIEFAMEMYIGGYDMAALWDNSDGGVYDSTANSTLEDHMLTSSEHGFRFNPSVYGLEFLARAANQTRLELNITGGYRVNGFAAQTTNNSVLLLLMNKYETEQHLRIALPRETEGATISTLVDTQDHWGTVVSAASPSSQINCTTNRQVDVLLPPVSFSLLELK